MKVYVTEPITEARILPTTNMSSVPESHTVEMFGCPGEFVPATFTLHPDIDITGIVLNISNLVSETGNIPSSSVDIRVVKCWYQSGEETLADHRVYNQGLKILKPELLLYNDDLVKVENNENYLLVNGEYVWISNPNGIEGFDNQPRASDFPVQDASTLQPIDIPANTNKQFWITVKIPNNTISGVYTGSIELIVSGVVIDTINLTLEVLPITLADSMLTYNIHYHGTTYDGSPARITSGNGKSATQYEADLTNMLNHGIVNCSTNLVNENILAARQSVGMTEVPLYIYGNGGSVAPAGTSPRLDMNDVENIMGLANQYGFTDVYFYTGYDEGAEHGYGPEMLSMIPTYLAIRAAGGKIWQYTCGYNQWWTVIGDFHWLGHALDEVVMYYDAARFSIADYRREAQRWHEWWTPEKGENMPWWNDRADFYYDGSPVPHKIYCYAYPWGNATENPGIWRQKHGLELWQRDYDGAFHFSYQSDYDTNIWNDYDTNGRKDAFTYPTIDGAIDTIQWEGYREGINDIRYLTTLIDQIQISQGNGQDTTGAEVFVDNLYTSNLDNLDINTVRSDIIDQILALKYPQLPSEKESVFIHFLEIPTASQIAEMELMGALLNLNSWIPPVGNHPDGFLTASIPKGSEDEFLALDYVTRINSAEGEIPPLPVPIPVTAGINIPILIIGAIIIGTVIKGGKG